MDVYQTLLQDHQTIQQILSKIEKTNVSEVERREVLFSTLREKLEAHEILEETIFYPEIDKFPIAGELVNVAFEEHAEFDAILQEISELPVDKPEWLERVAELKDLVQQHIINEENRMFPAARKELPDSCAEQLGRKIEELKRKDAPDRSLAGTSNRLV
jgi:iron-sulfur cluster repair protein YtfE (RIC family)